MTWGERITPSILRNSSIISISVGATEGAASREPPSHQVPRWLRAGRGEQTCPDVVWQCSGIVNKHRIIEKYGLQIRNLSSTYQRSVARGCVNPVSLTDRQHLFVRFGSCLLRSRVATCDTAARRVCRCSSRAGAAPGTSGTPPTPCCSAVAARRSRRRARAGSYAGLRTRCSVLHEAMRCGVTCAFTR